MKKRRIIFGIIGVVLVVVAGFFIWAESPSKPYPEALAALEPDMVVKVRELPNWILFEPQPLAAETTMILYPGARVDPRAYAPVAHAIAIQGYRVVVVSMPLNLAIFGVDKAAAVIAAYPDTKVWVIGGHSLGGSMAAQYAYNHADQIKGVFFWASYPPNNINLATRSIKVISISGTQDGLATPEKIDASRALLPQDTLWVPIDGGNHAQFGTYGPQSGDHAATITPQAQMDQVVSAMAVYLANLSR